MTPCVLMCVSRTLGPFIANTRSIWGKPVRFFPKISILLLISLLLQALEVNMFERHEYEAFEAEAYLNGAAQERKKNEAANLARDAKMAEYFRSKGVPDDIISGGLALK